MSRWICALAVAALSGCTCEGEVTRPASPGFEDAVLTLCAAGTTPAAVHTRSGGVLTLQVLDACRVPLRSCTTPDAFAPDAVATVRVAGSEVIAEGCVLSASDGSFLRARFVPRDAGIGGGESWDVPLRTCSDGGPARDAACPADGGI